MSSTPTRYSPVHHHLALLKPRWHHISDCPMAIDFGDVDAERNWMETVALCDVSALAKCGVVGPGAADWMTAQGNVVPQAIYDVADWKGGGLIARVGSEEVLLEDGVEGDHVGALQRAAESAGVGVHLLERQDATFLLSGPQCREVLGQTCGVNFADQPTSRLVMTRVAGITCAVLPQRGSHNRVYRFWLDYTYASDLWQTLAGIIGELGGGIVGAGVHYPQLIRQDQQDGSWTG